MPAKDEKPSRRPQAGKAFMEAARKDPKTQAALRRTQAKLMAFREAMRPLEAFDRGRKAVIAATMMPLALAHEIAAQAVVCALNAEDAKQAQADIDALWAKGGAEFDAMKNAWETQHGEKYPETVEEMKRLAVRAGLGADTVHAGRWTPADVLPVIEGYLQSLADQKAVRDDKSGNTGAAPKSGLPQTLAQEVPRGTNWEQIHIVVGVDYSLQIEVGEKKLGLHDMSELGLFDKRTRNKRKLSDVGRLFLALARDGGRTDWSSGNKTVKDLRRKLAAAFGIKGPPAVRYYRRNGGGYETAFEISHEKSDDGEE